MNTKECPEIVKGLWDTFDRCDPTRSHEMKPSDRMREVRQLRRIVGTAAFAILSISAMVASILWAAMQ